MARGFVLRGIAGVRRDSSVPQAAGQRNGQFGWPGQCGSIRRQALGRGCFVAVWWRYLLESCSQPRDLLAFLQQFLLLESALRPRLFLLGLPARVSQERFFVEHEHAHQKLNLQLLLFDLLLQRRGLRLPLLRILRIRGRFLGYRLYGCVSPRSLCWAGGRAWRK